MKNNLFHIRKLFIRLLLVLLMFEICRLIFLIFNWSYFSSLPKTEVASAFFYGLLFDISAITYFNVLFILLHVIPIKQRDTKGYQMVMKIIYLITNGAALMANIADSEYFKFSGKRTGFEFFKIKSEVGSMFMSYVKDYWYLFIIWIAMLLALHLLYKLTMKHQKTILNNKNIIIQSLMAIVLLSAFVVAARGGFYLKPIRPFDAARFAEPELISLITNTPHTMIMTIEDDHIPVFNYMSDLEAKKLYDPVHLPRPGIKNMGNENIMIIILESFGKEYIGYFNHGKGYTPFLDSLFAKSLVFKYSFANGKRSIDAMPAVLASLPSWMDAPYVNTSYQSNNISSLGKILSKEGYYTAYFHGGRNGTMAFDNFINVSAFGKYYGMNEYPNKSDFDGGWGIADEPFEQFMVQEINRNKQPFCVALFTLSSHQPYRFPAKYKNKFKGGPLPIHVAVQYADYSLKKFFESMSKLPWFSNTLFIITADHSAESISPYYQTMTGKYEVPIVFYKPGTKLIADTTRVVEQIDIMPSVLDYLNYPKRYFAFGNSVFDTSREGMAVQYNMGLWQIIQKPGFFVFSKAPVGYYKFISDSMLAANILNDVGPTVYYKIEKKLKAVQQVYSRSLNKNEMMVK
jgi:phosphoglycerol transferase MdoB-like AlkP superfamily enzyme